MEMADGRRREEWEQTLAIMSASSAKPIDVVALNPVKRLESPPNGEMDRAEAQEGWANLRAGFKAWVKHGRRRK